MNAAVGKENGTATLHYDKEGSGIASLYDRQLDYFGIDFGKSEEVQVVTLDSYCGEAGLDFIHLLKMDIEGNEYNALLGARNLLASGRIGLIQFEFGGCNIDSRTFFRDFWNLLHESYDIYRIMCDGFLKVGKYEELLECFVTTNYICSLKTLGGLNKTDG